LGLFISLPTRKESMFYTSKWLNKQALSS
jgi:hypothetical protein